MICKEKAYIQTSSNRSVHIYAPRPEQFDIEDIAHALSMQCRFNGHLNDFYSVAQHSVYVARLCPIAARPWGLLHDASEAYLGDLPTPVKKFMPQFVEVETAIENAICQRFIIERSAQIDAAVKLADRTLLICEANELHPHPQNIQAYGDTTIKLRSIYEIDESFYPWSPSEAEKFFLEEFEKVRNENSHIRY